MPFPSGMYGGCSVLVAESGPRVLGLYVVLHRRWLVKGVPRSVRDVVDLSVAAPLTTVQWDEMGGMIQNFKVMAAMAPRIKIPRSANANTGLVHYS